MKTVWAPAKKEFHNGQAAIDYALESAVRSPKVFGVTAAVLAGTAPLNLAATEWLEQFGSTAVTTDGGGNATITFPNAFPRALLSVVFSTNDSGATRRNTVSLTGFTIVSTPNSGSTICWIAKGC